MPWCFVCTGTAKFNVPEIYMSTLFGNLFFEHLLTLVVYVKNFFLGCKTLTRKSNIWEEKGKRLFFSNDKRQREDLWTADKSMHKRPPQESICINIIKHQKYFNIHFSKLLNVKNLQQYFCKMIWYGWSSNENWNLFIICDYLYQSGYYSYLIKVGLGEVRMLDVRSFALFDLGCFWVVQKLGSV